MKKEIRTIVYDEDLKIEAFYFEGIVQPFPNHFHEHYTIGFVEGGKRSLMCNQKEYQISKGSILLFHPYDNHSCAPVKDELFYYRGFQIPRDIMQRFFREITGKEEEQRFSKSVIRDEEVSGYLQPLHKMIMDGEGDFEKEETFCFLLSVLVEKYGQPTGNAVSECREEIAEACQFMEQHFAEHISLEQICRYCHLSKSTLLRAFTKEKGITPYRYLETVRINEAKKMLEQGEPLAKTAFESGFSD